MAKKDRFLKNVKLVKNESNFLKITNENNQLYFEIGNEITTDLSEAIALMIRIKDIDLEIWNTPIETDINLIEPIKALYWLTGGDREWVTLKHYKMNWCDCSLDFLEEWGIIIMSIFKKSKTWGDVRDGYIKYLNLPALYEFALTKNLIRLN